MRVKIKLILLMVVGALTSQAAEFNVNTAAAIRNAFGNANPGDIITIEPGFYNLVNELSTGKNGTAEKPIIVRSVGLSGYAELKAQSQVAFRVKNKFWVFMGIHFQGSTSSTEAILFIDGPNGCSDVLFRCCKISDSSAYGVKGAKTRASPAHRVVFERTELYNTQATGFDLVSGDDWRLTNNYVHDYGKGGGVSYGIFLKGGGFNGVVEGNLVDGKDQSTTVGISFGGGLTGEQWLPLLPDGSLGPEHQNGIARNNIVKNTSDVAYHSNHARYCYYYNNLAWNTGSGFQNQKPYSANTDEYPVLINNLLKGVSKAHSSSRYTVQPQTAWFINTAVGDFRLSATGIQQVMNTGELLTDNPTDLFGFKRTVAGLGPVLPGSPVTTAWSDPLTWISLRQPSTAVGFK